MSSIYGIFHRDGSPVDSKEAERFAASFEWWKPDESDFVVEDSIMLGQATLWNTPESHHEHLPLRRGSLTLVADARIDNREELAKELDLPDMPMEHIGDGEFILAAYRKWGEACPEKLLGDYAFAIWDEAKRELFCARDFIGVRPLYFYTDERIFVFGSEIEGILNHPVVPRTIRDASVANHLANRALMDHRHTFYEKIYKLQAGFTLRIGRDEKRFRRYWDIRRVEPIKLESKEAYVRHLRELLEDAVRVRMRTSYGVSAHLSGGLDSSPIAVLAARELRRRSAEPLHVYSWHLPPGEGDDPEHFEWRYPRTVAAQEGMVLHWGNLELDRVYLELKEGDITLGETQQFWYEYFIRDELQARGVRTMLSGWGGDEFITNHAYAFYSELFLRGKWGRLVEVAKKRGMRGAKEWLKFIYKRIFVPLMPDCIYCHLPRIRCSELETEGIRPEFVEAVRREWRRKNHIFSRDTSALVRTDLYRAWDNAHVQARLDAWAQGAKRECFVYAYPLLDRRIVEFSVSMPTEYLHNEGKDRYLYRLAIEDLLPYEALWQQGKSESNRFAQLTVLYEELFERLQKEKDLTQNNQYIQLEYNFTFIKRQSTVALLPLIYL